MDQIMLILAYLGVIIIARIYEIRKELAAP
jgi:hypothetical protein